MRQVVQDWTGEYQPTCPWRAFTDPFVVRVLQAHRWYESGQLEFAYPNASNRLVEGIECYHQIYEMVASKQLRKDREQREAERKIAQVKHG